MSTALHKLSDEELLARMQELGKELEDVNASAGRELERLYRESDEGLSYLESVDIDSDLEPLEAAFGGDLKRELERTEAAVARGNRIMERMEAESADEEARAEEDEPDIGRGGDGGGE